MRKITPLVLAIALVALVGCAAKDDQVSEKQSSGNTTAEGQAGSSDDSRNDEPEKTGGESVEVTETGFSANPGYDGALRANAAAVIVNHGTEPLAFFEVVFTFSDAAGAPVATETSYVYYVAPGKTAYAVVDQVQVQGTPATVKASAVVKDSFIEFEGTSIDLTVTSVAAPQYGDGTEVHGTAANPSTDVLDGLSVNCVLRTGGVLVGGLTTHLDTLVPAGNIAWDGSTSVVVGADSAACTGSEYS